MCYKSRDEMVHCLVRCEKYENKVTVGGGADHFEVDHPELIGFRIIKIILDSTVLSSLNLLVKSVYHSSIGSYFVEIKF